MNRSTLLYGIFLCLIAVGIIIAHFFKAPLTPEEEVEREAVVLQLKDVEVGDIIIFHGGSLAVVYSGSYAVNDKTFVRLRYVPLGEKSSMMSIEHEFFLSRQFVVIGKDHPDRSKYCEIFVQEFAGIGSLRDNLPDELKTSQPEPTQDEPEVPNPEPEEPNAPRAFLFLLFTLYFLLFYLLHLPPIVSCLGFYNERHPTRFFSA